MTVEQLIKHLQKLGEENLEKEIIMFDCSSYYTPYKVELMKDDKLGRGLTGKILID